MKKNSKVKCAKSTYVNLHKLCGVVGGLVLLASCGEPDDADRRKSSTTEAAATVGVGADSAPAPRYPDGLVRFDRVPGEVGYWGNPNANSLMELGVDVEVDDSGLLSDIGDASRVAPFMPWSLALYKYRQANGLKNDPIRACISPAGPRHLMDEGGFRIVQDRNYDRVYLVFGGGNMNWRVIFMDGRVPPDPEEVTGTYFGHSVGRWEGDTLIVQSSGFIDRFWFSNGGLPHTRALKLEERFTRTNYDTLTYEVTIDDPFTYTRPWKSAWNLQWMEGKEIEEKFCEDTREYGQLVEDSEQ